MRELLLGFGFAFSFPSPSLALPRLPNAGDFLQQKTGTVCSSVSL